GITRVAGLGAHCDVRLISMTVQADPVRLRRRQLCRVPYIGRRYTLDVFASGPVAGLAGIAFEAMMVDLVDGFMRTFEEAFRDVFMAGAASLRSDECIPGGFGGRRRRVLRPAGQRQKQECQTAEHRHIHDLVRRLQYCAWTLSTA